MDLTQLANLGEFVGGIAVLVTLVYLAIQIRQSNELARADAVHKAVNTWSASRQMLVDDALSGVLAKARNEEELSSKEQIQLFGFLSELTYASWSVYTNPRFVRPENGAITVARYVGRSSVLRETWAEVADELRSYDLGGFAEEVTRRLESTDLAARSEGG